MDEDLEAWSRSLSPVWYYTDVAVEDTVQTQPLALKYQRHEYPNLWIADIWNNWRALRILVCRYALREDGFGTARCHADKVKAHSQIQQYSRDICKSVPSFIGSSRKYFE